MCTSRMNCKVFVINLDRRTDRMQRITSMLSDMGVEFERFRAIEGRDSVKACRQSHLEVLRMQVERGLNKVLILEDDAVLERMPTEEEFNAEWDQLYLGGNHSKQLTPLKGTLQRCRSTYTTHAYG